MLWYLTQRAIFEKTAKRHEGKIKGNENIFYAYCAGNNQTHFSNLIKLYK